MTYYKILSNDGTSCNGGSAQWSLPQDGQPGEWMPAIEGELVPCERGYHLCRERDLLQWLGPAIYEAEARGEIVECDDKIVVREARLLRRLPWDERIARLFACDCAERVLPIYERKYPDGQRPRQAIEMARRYADGQATDNELAAARAAAWDAALDAAWDAALAADRDAAWDAERQWQTARLMEYLAQAPAEGCSQ